MPSTDGVDTRRAALQMLDSVLRRGTTMEGAGQAARQLAPADRSLAFAIAGETLRRLPDVDDLIDSATRQPLPDDSKARMVLRLALAQKMAMQVPDHAIVATSLPLVDGGPRRLVHGVLGTLLRRGIEPVDAPRLPHAVEQRWSAAWGDAAVAAARRQIAQRPALDLSFADDRVAQDYALEHGGQSLAPRHVRVASSSVAELAGFGEGGWWVQDLAASLPARLIPGEAANVLDLCAAPGGKTMQLAAAGHRVTSIDASESRLGRLRDNLERTKLRAELIAADALRWEAPQKYDAILLDAPCSSTGTFRRHPEILYRARPQIIADSAGLQQRLLGRAAEWLKPGGALVYSVCSLEPEEGEQRVAAFLAAQPDFRRDPARADELPPFVMSTADGSVRVVPGQLEAEGGLDGFYIARLMRA
jgi:16S rRNA (cytosine967-C5)-methyltransferase